MDLNAQKDHFSRAVVRAVAATAGIKATVPELDEDSEDVTFTAPSTDEAPSRKLDAQLKFSENIRPQDGAFSFPLEVKNYNDLRWPDSERYVPIILIVVHVPADPAEWMISDPDRIVLKRCAYWVSLAGAPATENTSSVSVRISTEQVFAPASLTAHLVPPGAAL
jgi:hypothetical protein